jgi:SulP family sulfate permease
VPSGFLPLTLPVVEQLPTLIVPALAIAILGLVQSAGISRGMAEPDNHTGLISHDFLSQGMSNLVVAFFQGMPVGGSISRTAVNISAGAQSRSANLVAGLLVGTSLLFLGSLVERIPLSALAGVLIVAALGLMEFKRVHQVWCSDPSGKIAMVVTFVATLVLPLEYSIYLGVLLSVLLYLNTSSRQVRICQLIPKEDGDFWEREAPPDVPASHPLILEIHGSLYFGAVYTLEKLLPSINGTRSPVVILRLHRQEVLGSTFLQLLERYTHEIHKHEGRFMLCGMSQNILNQLERSGLLDLIGPENVFISDDTLLVSTRRAFSTGRSWMQRNGQHHDKFG